MSEHQPEAAAAAAEHADHGPNERTYVMVFGALAVLTGMSFGAYELLKGSPNVALVVIMLISTVKALLVATIFMHLKWDWNNLYFLIIPAFILGLIIVVVLLPDIVLLQY